MANTRNFTEISRRYERDSLVRKAASGETGAAEDLGRREQFDAIFCNSAAQWFRAPAQSDGQKTPVTYRTPPTPFSLESHLLQEFTRIP